MAGGSRFTGSCLFTIGVALAFVSCAALHHVQVGDLDDNSKYALRPFELKVSESGVNFEEAGRIIQTLNNSKVGKKDVGNASSYIQLFQQGPRTGEPVFTESYAQNIVNDVYRECPTGKITGLMSIRESRKYPVISGEIVKIKGYCMLPRTASKTSSKNGKSSNSK